MTAAIAVTGRSVEQHRAVFVSAMLMLTFLFAINTVNLLTELYAIPARHLLNSSDDNLWRDRERLYGDAIGWADKALALRVDNPDFHEVRARLMMERCQHWDITAQWQAWQECQRSALTQMQHAVSLNPRWPYAWANVLLLKFQLREFDDEFFAAWQHCKTLGASEFAVNRIVAYVGMTEWPRWEPEQRQTVREALRAVQAVEPSLAKTLADETGNHLLYCLWTAGDPRQHYSCNRKPHKRSTHQTSNH